MRGRRVAVIVAVAALTGCAGTSSSSEAACEPPTATLPATSVQAGQKVTLTAERMWDGCNDQGSQAPLPPLQDQEVEWAQHGRTTVLGAADADRRGTVKVTVTVPVTAKAGPATVRVGVGNPTPVMVSGPAGLEDSPEPEPRGRVDGTAAMAP